MTESKNYYRPVCLHGKKTGGCRFCHPTYFCKHSRLKYKCKDCGGSQICVHGKVKQVCKECHGSAICEHNHIRRSCKKCHGVGVCVHNKNRQACKECKGSQICEHNKNKSQCRFCGGLKVWAKQLGCTAKSRAKELGLPYNLKADWIIEQLKKGCPVFKRPFEINEYRSGLWAATIDKFKPELGYTETNSFVISRLANNIKSNANSEQVFKVAEWMKGVENEELSSPINDNS